MTGDSGEEERTEPRRISDINSHELVSGFARLKFFDDNTFLRMQAHNVAIVDKFIMELENKALHALHAEERSPPDSMFLSAQTQMWIFGVYELMRTWRQRVREFLRMSKNGQLQEKVSKVKITGGYREFSEGIYHRQAKELLDNPALADVLEADLLVSEVPFTWLEAVRMPLESVHEVHE